MKLIVGLGNPGMQYNNTRHNAGFMVVDALASKFAVGQIAKSRFNSVTLDANIGCEKCLLMKPTTFMNRSGQSVGEALRFFKLDPQDDLLVIVDDIALPVGSIRIRKSGGAGGHNGLSDIDRVLGGASYPRIRIGVGEVPRVMNQADWVLSKFMSEEMDKVNESLQKASNAIEHIFDHDITSAMNTFNEKLVKPKRKEHPNDNPAEDSNDDQAVQSTKSKESTNNNTPAT
jgi:peptidyl-tRNA hydrolase, PTH1 family|tara:strand:+ start:2377 stop:3066 length:690 start_codon:yes stop_codon:yes gene_type:complete